LTIGDSRSGKTTFVEYLKNLNYIVEAEVFRGTVDPKAETLFLKYGNRYLHLNFIDTPGLNEVGGDNRSNEVLRELITRFVKRDVTRLNMVLLTINCAGGLTALQVESATTVISFLGRDLMKNVVVLVTHFDVKSAEEEKKWTDTFKADSNVRFISHVCGDRYLFTGAIDSAIQKNVAVRDQFMALQKTRLQKFLNMLMGLKAEDLHMASSGDPSKNFRQSMFVVTENIVNDYVQISTLVPQIDDLNRNILVKRMELSAKLLTLEGGTYQKLRLECEEAIAQAGNVGTEHPEDSPLPKFDLALKADIKRYTTIQTDILSKYAEAMRIFSDLSQIYSTVVSASNMLEYSEDFYETEF